MRAARTLLISATLLTAAACSPRAFSVECVGPGRGLLPGECEHVADQVAPQVGLQQEGFGKLMVVSIEVVDCRAEGAASNIDRCWHVVLDYESGSMSWLATRDRESGAIGVQQ
jgi:hypothetical protein